MQVRLQREPGAPDQEWQWRLEVRGIGSQAQARVRARLESLDPQNSRLHYQVTLEQVGGLLRAVQSSLLQAAMEKTIRDFLDRLEQQLRTHYGSG
jgi:carbon monoxide dehydrogenase subunit G